METIYWGIKDNKRKAEHDIGLDNKKKRKIIMIDNNNKSIYTIGTEIHFTDSINKRTIETLIRSVTKLINKHHKEYEGGTEKLKITIVVDSPGGCVTSVLKWVDFVARIKSKYPYVEFVSIATGMSASASTILCVSCDRRLSTRYANHMIHQLRSGTSGKYTELMSYGKHLSDLHEILLDIYMERCKVTRKELEEFLKDESWMTSKEYLKLGLIDEII